MSNLLGGDRGTELDKYVDYTRNLHNRYPYYSSSCEFTGLDIQEKMASALIVNPSARQFYGNGVSYRLDGLYSIAKPSVFDPTWVGV